MASAAAVAPVAAPSSIPDDAFRLVPWASCVPSPLNPRKHFDRARLEELAGTMGSEVGVIEPLVVRPAKAKGQFEIIAGERRWRAAEIAGLTVVPVIVRERLSDVQVLRMMVIENKQREDLNALEEAEGFFQLTKRGVDIDSIAADIKLSRKYVYDRLKLRDLVPVGQRLLAAERISAGHAILIAREAPDVQARILDPEQVDDGYRAPLFQHEGGEQTPAEEEAEDQQRKKDPYVGLKTRSVRELAGWIVEHARFDTKAVNAELYPETARAVVQAVKVVQITRNSFTQPDAKAGNTQRIFHASSWKRADGQLDHEGFGKPKASKTCERSVLGVVVAGPGRGEAFTVCVNKDCDVHWKTERLARAKASSGNAAAQERYRRQEAQRDAKFQAQQQRVEQERAAITKAKPEIVEAFVARIKGLPLEKLSAFVLGELHTSAPAATKALGAPKTADDWLRAVVLAAVLRVYRDAWSAHRNIPEFAGKLGVDLKPLLKAAAVQTSAQAAKKSAAKASKKKR